MDATRRVPLMQPIEPAPCPWEFPLPQAANEQGLVCTGGDLEPGTLLTAYRMGLFPMPIGRRRLAWWSPDPRGVLPLDGLRVSRSLRASCRRFEVRINTSFSEVMTACADPGRPRGWITREFISAYVRLHQLGWAHSVETWLDGQLMGGLYGVGIGRFFAGESMFYRAPDASKVALVALVEHLRAQHAQLLDVQWLTPHLTSLGAVNIHRIEYLERLADAIA
jgi:leucyl/phenylalanyl-tRNA--protein transferase